MTRASRKTMNSGLHTVLYTEIPTNNFFQFIMERGTWDDYYRFALITLLPKGMTMAKNRNFTNIDFVRHSLSRDEKTSFEKWFKSLDTYPEKQIAELLDTGNKMSLAYDSENDCFIVSVTCRKQGDANENVCFSSRGPDLNIATGVALFKLFVLYKDRVWLDISTSSDWG